MASAAETSIASTVLTVDGTPTQFLPLPTPWPSGNGCAENIYLHTPVSNPNTFLAWDPLYGASMVSSARSCLPPQVTSWWSQAASATPYTALGPTFVFPQAYSAVQTVLVASSLQQIFCCPSQYSLLVPQPNQAHNFPSQCISTVSIGQTFAFLSSQGLPDAFTATAVMTSSATVFGIPVNGFNFATDSIPSSQTITTTDATVTSPGTAHTSTAPTTSTAPPTSTGADAASQPTSSKAPLASPSLEENVGISVGVVFAVLFVGVVAYMAWKRRKQARPSVLLPAYQSGGFDLPSIMKAEGYGVTGGTPLSPKEMPSTQIYRVYELPGK